MVPDPGMGYGLVMQASGERPRFPARGRGQFTDAIYEEPDPGGSEPVCPPAATTQVTTENVEPTTKEER